MTIVETKSTIARRWREGGASDSPAGALYASGAHSEADMIGRTGTGSGKCGTVCTGSITNPCC